MLRNAFLSARV